MIPWSTEARADVSGPTFPRRGEIPADLPAPGPPPSRSDGVLPVVLVVGAAVLLLGARGWRRSRTP